MIVDGERCPDDLAPEMARWVLTHEIRCPFRRVMIVPVTILCDHGFEVCVACDACTCGGERRELAMEILEATKGRRA